MIKNINKTNRFLFNTFDLNKKSKVMNTEELNFIKGLFSTVEAKDILLNLIDNKIKFHNQKTFSEIERFGIKNEDSNTRINELLTSRSRIIDFIAKCQENNEEISIHSQISIESVSKKEVV